MAVGMVPILAFIREPAVGPDLGGAQRLRASAEDDPHGLIVENKREAGHARTNCKQSATTTIC
jgi:hypothetical protein